MFDAGYCHCARCRRRSGAPVSAFVHVPSAAFTVVTGEVVSDAEERLGREMVCARCHGDVYFEMTAGV